MKQHGSWWGARSPGEVAEAVGTLLPGLALVATDGARTVRLWNGEAERLLGLPRGAVLDRPCPDGLVCDVGSAGPRPFGARVVLRRADGSPVHVRQWSQVFHDDDGGVAGALHVFQPVEPPVTLGGLDLPVDVVRFHGLVTREPSMIAAIDTIRRVAGSDVTVLLRGESGTGKELAARALHAESPRRGGPFVAVNAAAIAPTLIESELFGHVRGAFTGATEDRPGIFRQADGGTLFLDEVAELAPDAQAKLLRVLQERVVVPVGGTRASKIDVRVVAATHRSLREEVRAGRFREDLMFRLRVVPIFLPPLRDRRLDVELLLRHRLAEASERGHRRVERIAPEALRALLAHDWPGNVRELENVVAYATAVGTGPELGLDDLPPELREPQGNVPAGAPTRTALLRPARRRRAGDIGAAELEAALVAAEGDVGSAAARLGLSRTTFWRRRRALGLA